MSDKNMAAVLPNLSQEDRVFLYTSKGFSNISVCSTSSFVSEMYALPWPKSLPELTLTKRSVMIELLEKSSWVSTADTAARIIKIIKETP